MKTARAVATVVGLVTLIWVAGSASVRAAEPELGATIESVVYVSEDDALTLWNRSTVEAAFTLTPSGGWTLDRDTVTLAPDEKSSIQIIGAGDDGATITVRVVSTAPTPEGEQRSELLLASRVFTERPVNLLSIALTVFAVVVGILAFLFTLRRVRPWELRVTRS